MHYDTLKDETAKATIAELTAGYAEKIEYFVDRLARGLARIAAAFHPNPVIVRMSDFKTNEYANLIGGAEFEPKEENPMLGFRGASRYYSPRYRDGFALECRAILRLLSQCRRYDSVLPFHQGGGPRARGHGRERIATQRERLESLRHVRDSLECHSGQIVCPALRRLLDWQQRSHAAHLGVDRDSADLAELFDEQDEAVKWMIRSVIEEAHKAGATVGLCGQAPSDHPEFADFLVDCGIDSISVSPDSFIAVKEHVAAREAAARTGRRGGER